MHPSCFVLSTGAEESADTVHLGHLLLHFSKPTSSMCQMLAGMAHAGNMRCSGAAQNRKCLTYFINSFAVRLRLHLATRFNHDAWIGCILATHPIPLAHAWMENPSLSLDIWKKVDVMGGLAGILTIITK